MSDTTGTMRVVDHEEVIEELHDRGYDPSEMWVGELQEADIDQLHNILESDASRTSILDWLTVEGQVLDGLFEDPRSEYDFTRFFTEHKGLVARMLYYMISTQGTEYDYHDLVSDIAELSNHPMYDAPFDRSRALNADPEE